MSSSHGTGGEGFSGAGQVIREQVGHYRLVEEPTGRSEQEYLLGEGLQGP